MKEKERLITLVVTGVLAVSQFLYGNDFVGWLLVIAFMGNLAILFLANDKLKESLITQAATLLIGLVATLLKPEAFGPYLIGIGFVSITVGVMTYFWWKKTRGDSHEK